MPFDTRIAGAHQASSCQPSEQQGSGHPSDVLAHLFIRQGPRELRDKYTAGERPSDEKQTSDPDSALAPPSLRHHREIFGELVNGPISLPRSPRAVHGCGVTGRCRRSVLWVPPHGLGEHLGFLKSRVVVDFKGQYERPAPSAGVELVHLFGERADPTRLQGAQDIVLDELRGTELELIIYWPGYAPARYMIRVDSEHGGPLTRFDLAKQITLAYAFFFINIERDCIFPSPSSFYNIALRQGQNRTWNSLGIQLLQLRLVRFRDLVGGSWIAEVEVVM